MPTIAEVRAQFPQYNDMSDGDLAGALHKKFYADMPEDVFNQKIGLKAEPVKPPDPEKPTAWSDIPGQAAENFIPSAGRAVAGVVGTGLKAAKAAALLPWTVTDLAKQIHDNPDIIRQFPAEVWRGLTARYGSLEAIKHTIATDPAGFALDAATLISGGEAAASRVARGVGEIGRAADVSKPFYDLPREPPPAAAPVAAPATPPPIPSPVQDAIQSQPLALRSDNRVVQQAGQFFSKMPFGGAVGKAIEAVPEKFGEARDATADQFGGFRTKQNVGGDIAEQLGAGAAAEKNAAEAAAQKANETAQAEYEQANQAREQAIAAQEQRSAQATQQQVGSVPPVTMGDAIIDTVRDSHDQARAAKDEAYRTAGEMDATVLDQANGSAHDAVLSNLRSDADGQGRVDMTASAAKAARGMMAKIRAFSNDARQRYAGAVDEAVKGGGTAEDAADTGRSMRDIEGLRQDLNFHASGADNDADRRAARRILGAFDEWHGNAVENHLMEGSNPDALPAMQQARALNRDFRQRFGYNDRNDADTILNKIVQPGNQIGPDDISRALFAGGNKPARLLDAVYAATGDHPNHGNVVQSVRSGFYNKLGTTPEGLAHPPLKTAGNIGEFLANREMSSRVFTPQDQSLLRSHATTLRNADQAREEAAALAKANKPVPVEAVKGPMQELADRVIGHGQKPAEAVFDAIEGYAKAKGGGKDIETLARVMRNIPEELRGNFRNTFIRRLGTGVKGEFSPAVFAKEWIEHVNPQAKLVLFGDGAHVKALDELAEASRQFDEKMRRFGNPSGSGQMLTFGKSLGAALSAVVAGHVIGPLGIVAGALGTLGASKLLASPAGASSAARFARRMQALQDVPTLANTAAARLAMRNMRNTATSLGIQHNIPDEK